jgi:hypothetical protein
MGLGVPASPSQAGGAVAWHTGPGIIERAVLPVQPPAVPTLLAMGRGPCAMFAFLVPAGAYFGLVRSTRPSYGVQRRLLDASVAACAAAIVALAFRNSLWWAVGSNSAAAGPSQFATLTGGAVLLSFLVVAGAETLLCRTPELPTAFELTAPGEGQVREATPRATSRFASIAISGPRPVSRHRRPCSS